MSTLSPFLEDAEAPLDLWTPEPVTAESMEGEDWEASEAPAGIEPWAETSPAVHPLTRVFPLPGAVLDALSGGLAPLAVGLAASAGYTDVNQLTNIVFYFRHPELIGRKIEPGQRALAEEWVSIRDRIVKPALQSVPPAPAPKAPAPAPVARRPGGTVARPASLSSSRLAWPGHSEAELAFMRAVYDRQARGARGDFVVDLPETALDPIEGHKARKDAAAAMKALLAEARAALTDESPNKQIGIISAYRPASRQFTIWMGREPQGKDAGSGFPHYYRRAIREGIVRADDYSPDAVDKVARFVGRFIASPGYSNHQDGLAFDLGTNDVGKKGLKKLYTGAWFHNWLKKNGKRLRFRPLADEPWHWTYEPSSGSELEAELGETTPPGVRPGRLEVRSVPMLASHRGSPPDLILRWNQMTAVPEAIDVVVHLHGFWYAGMRLPRDIEPVSGLDLAPISGTTGAARTRPTLTVLPRGHDTRMRQKFKRKDGSIAYGYNAMTFPALVTRNGLTDLVRLSLERFAAAVGGSPPRVGRLILTAHSGGGKALLQLLEHHDPHQVHVFDALYWSPEPLERWARRRIERDKAELASGGAAYMATRGGALRVFYQGRTARGTTPASRRLQAALAPSLEGELARWYRVEASAFDHFQIPRRYGWRVLADASADVPEARVAPLGGRGASELAELGGETSFEELEQLEQLEELEELEQLEEELEEEHEEEHPVDELEPPPLNALPEPVSRRARHEVPESDSEAALWEAKEDAFDESAAAGLFDEPEAEELFDQTEGPIGLAPDAEEDEEDEEAAESLYEGVDLSGEDVEPEVTFEWAMEEPESEE